VARTVADSAALQAIIDKARKVAVAAAQEAALEAAREVSRKTAQAQAEMMALFAQQQREMLSAVTSATGALESRLAKIEGAASPANVVPANGAPSGGQVDVSDSVAFERMRQAAKASVLTEGDDGAATPKQESAADDKTVVF
jgi:hypothetical protein